MLADKDIVRASDGDVEVGNGESKLSWTGLLSPLYSLNNFEIKRY